MTIAVIRIKGQVGLNKDIVESEKGKRFKNQEEYTNHVRKINKKFGTLESYVEHLKQIGEY